MVRYLAVPRLHRTSAGDESAKFAPWFLHSRDCLRRRVEKLRKCSSRLRWHSASLSLSGFSTLLGQSWPPAAKLRMGFSKRPHSSLYFRSHTGMKNQASALSVELSSRTWCMVTRSSFLRCTSNVGGRNACDLGISMVGSFAIKYFARLLSCLSRVTEFILGVRLAVELSVTL